MSRRLPNLAGLRAFDAAGRHVSFSKVALELNVTQSAVSRLIRKLESNLGVDLFVRNVRSVSLTKDGLAFLSEVQRALTIIEEATNSLVAGSKRQALRIGVLPSFAAHWLVPPCGQKTQRY